MAKVGKELMLQVHGYFEVLPSSPWMESTWSSLAGVCIVVLFSLAGVCMVVLLSLAGVCMVVLLSLAGVRMIILLSLAWFALSQLY